MLYAEIILSAVSYGCETWSVISRKEGIHIAFFENKLLNKICGPNTARLRKKNKTLKHCILRNFVIHTGKVALSELWK